MASIENLPGNLEVIKLLEACLEKARKGRITHGVVSLIEEPGKVTGGMAGAFHVEETARRALAKLDASLAASILNRTLPERDESLDASHACFNVPAGPLCYDFANWLILAEMRRIREGAPAPLKVAFWFGRDGKGNGMEIPYRRKMLDNVVRPMLDLIDAVEDRAALGGRCDEVYLTRAIVDAADRGEPVPRFRASEEAIDAMAQYKNYVTITLRESEEWPHRNSNIENWVKFARHLQCRGERVVFVRDTAAAFSNQVSAVPECPRASLHLRARMGLYQVAKANLFVSNGPAALAFFSDRPWLCFMPLNDDDHPYKPQTPSFMRENIVDPYGQFPWSRPDQRIVWEADNYESIIAAWDQFMAGTMIAAE